MTSDDLGITSSSDSSIANGDDEEDDIQLQDNDNDGSSIDNDDDCLTEAEAAKKATTPTSKTTTPSSSRSNNTSEEVSSSSSKKRAASRATPRKVSIKRRHGSDNSTIDNELSQWREIMCQAKADEARAKMEEQKLAREKWTVQKEEGIYKNKSQYLVYKIELMKKYKEMRNLGFTDDVIAESVEDMKPLIAAMNKSSDKSESSD